MLKHTIPAALAKHGPLTKAGLVALIEGASRSGIHLVIQALKANGKIHISGYVRSNGKVGGAHAPIYKLGNRPDVPKPETRKDRQNARKQEAQAKPEAVKPAVRRGGRKAKVKPLVQPQAQPAMHINRAQDLGVWGGLMV